MKGYVRPRGRCQTRPSRGLRDRTALAPQGDLHTSSGTGRLTRHDQTGRFKTATTSGLISSCVGVKGIERQKIGTHSLLLGLMEKCHARRTQDHPHDLARLQCCSAMDLQSIIRNCPANDIGPITLKKLPTSLATGWVLASVLFKPKLP